MEVKKCSDLRVVADKFGTSDKYVAKAQSVKFTEAQRLLRVTAPDR